MKKCCICKEEKELAEFNKNKTKKTGLNSNCRECAKILAKEHYKKNNVLMKKQIHDKKLERIIDNRKKLYSLLLESSCMDCGIKNPIVLDFDHREQDGKFLSVSELIVRGYGWNKIEKEIDKCDIRCSNCHRIRTSIQLNWWYNRL